MQKLWVPSTVPSDKKILFAVQMAWPISKEQHWDAMLDKVVKLLDACSYQEAKDILEKSIEHLPELFTIPINYDRKYWSIGLMNSDTMSMSLNQIQWEKEFALTDEDEIRYFMDELEEQTLLSFIEKL